MNRMIAFFALALAVCLAATNVNAMPLFARKLNVPCAMCHTTIPRLNETGYKFRAAGFRMPEMIGQPDTEKFELGNYFSARAQARYDTQVTNQPNGAPVASVVGGVALPRTTSNAFSFQEFTLYPLTGSWGKYLGSLAELSLSPEDFFEVENAYVRFVYGNAKRFFTSRVGIFHSWEGFGGSDRPYSNARPFFQTIPQAAAGTGIPYVFQPWGLDEAGVEIGGDINKLSLRAAIMNGTLMRWDGDANTFLAFPAQTGPWKGANQAVAALGRPFNSVAHNTPDFSANITYLLHSNGGGFTLLYYRGNIATPTACENSDGTFTKIGATGTDGLCGVAGATSSAPFGTVGPNTNFDFTRSTAFRNNFDRLAFYLSYPLGKRFLPQGGFILGRDDQPVSFAAGPVPTVTAVHKFDSRGWFLEGAYAFSDYVTAGFRYDRWKPKYSATSFNTQWAVTPYVSIPLQNGFQVIAEYQHRDFLLNAAQHHRQNDTFQARVIFIK